MQTKFDIGEIVLIKHGDYSGFARIRDIRIEEGRGIIYGLDTRDYRCPYHNYSEEFLSKLDCEGKKKILEEKDKELNENRIIVLTDLKKNLGLDGYVYKDIK